MSVLVIYKTANENTRAVEEFLHDFERQTGQKLKTVDPDSRDGANTCRLYDVVEYPTVLALSNDGQLLSSWRGVPLPLINEVNYYV